MKKIIFFTLFVLMLGSVFAFEVLNSNDESQIYFNTNNDNVKVKANSSATILKVDYVGSSPRTQIYPFGACSGNKCVTFDLTDLVESNNDSLDSSIEFSLDVNGTIKKIYLDTEKPEFNLTKTDIDTVNRKVNFEFTYSDNVEFSRLQLFEKTGSTESFIANLTGNSYTFNSVSKSIYEFVFKFEDVAGNKDEFSKTVNLGDLTNPVINEAFLIKGKDSTFELQLKLSDNEKLIRYEITQGSISLSEDISGTSYSKNIKIPFTKGTISLKVFDDKGNSVTKSLNLDVSISNSYSSKYYNSKYFKLTSNADMCKLIKVDGKSESDTFDKDGKEFEVRVSAPVNENIKIEFYCEKSGFREYFERDFFYDNEDPSNSNLSIQKTSEGYLKLSWTKSEDKQSEVEYILYRDDSKIYSGSKLEFIDQKVSYPNEYEYYLRVEDEAGNYVKTDTISEVPNKVNVFFELNENFANKVQDSKYNFIFETEKGVNAVLRVENNGKEIANQKFKTTSEKVSINLELLKGQNLIYLDLVDNFGNKNSQDFYVIYEPVVLAESTENQIKETQSNKVPISQEKVISEPKNESNIQNKENISSYSSWIWFVIILGAFAYFVWFFIINEDALKLKDKYRARKNRTVLDKKRKYDSSFFAVKRNKDNVLAKDFDRIKRERIQKQEAKKFEELQKKKLEEKQIARTDLERKKLEDLSRSKKQEVIIPFSQRIKAKRSATKIKNEIDYVDELASSKSSINEKPKKSFFSFFEKKEEKPQSEMDKYLSKTTSNRGWSSSSDYVFKPEIKSEIVQPKENLTELKTQKEIQNSQVEKKGWFNKSKKEDENQQESFSQNKKVHLDDYLSNIAKKKKRKSFYFAEKTVNRDLEDRN